MCRCTRAWGSPNLSWPGVHGGEGDCDRHVYAQGPGDVEPLGTAFIASPAVSPQPDGSFPQPPGRSHTPPSPAAALTEYCVPRSGRLSLSPRMAESLATEQAPELGIPPASSRGGTREALEGNLYPPYCCLHQSCLLLEHDAGGHRLGVTIHIPSPKTSKVGTK